MIKNIIFDIGNVLSDFRWKEFLQEKGFDEQMTARIAKASILSPAWLEYDRGAWSEEKIMQTFIAADPEIEQELHRAFDNVAGMVAIRDYAISWIQELQAKGYRVFYLSNFSHKTQNECPDSLAFLPLMDGGILSYQEKLVKPEPAIYQLLLERYGLRADESVFLDDTPENIKAAEALGIHGICFTTKERAQEELSAFGVR